MKKVYKVLGLFVIVSLFLIAVINMWEYWSSVAFFTDGAIFLAVFHAVILAFLIHLFVRVLKEKV